jgi:hypothetical protein
MLIVMQVYEMTNDEAYRAVKWALDAGYRHIDTAEWCVPFPFPNPLAILTLLLLVGTKTNTHAAKPSPTGSRTTRK